MNKVLVTVTCLILTACSALLPVSVHAAEDLLIFPEIRTTRVNDDVSNSSDTIATVDFFGSASYGQLRLLGEVFVTEDSIEAERLQIGYDFTSLTTAWAGRYHNPLGYWNTQYHHGTYLQTSISRPEIAKLEHNGGLFPSHVTGLLLETSHAINSDGFLDFSFAAGTSPELSENNELDATGPVLHPMKIFDPSKGNHKLNLTARIVYRPDAINNNQLGLFASQVEVAANDLSVNSVDLSIAGLYIYWETQNLNIYSSLFFARDIVTLNMVKNKGSFTSGYVQLDYLLQGSWTLYGRVENTYGETGDPYLTLMENFSPEAQVAGIRWDIFTKQALKLEASRKLKAGKTFITTMLNWSASFP
jgi:hypothetical protein